VTTLNIPSNTFQRRDESPPLRFEFLDGLRGLMALYVVLFHACYFAREVPLHPIIRFFTNWISYGHFGVDVFIVLSGFCLMMPVAQAKTSRLPRGFGNYIRRRARRILPPYYAALFFSFILVLIGQSLQRSGSVAGTHVNDVFTPGIIISHLLLIHNFDFVWAYRINGPMWSVATEWQIYFLFPMLLLPLLRRFGHIAMTTIAFLIGLIPLFVFPEDANFYWASPWFLGLFAMGMVGADITLGAAAGTKRWHRMLGQWPVGVGVLLAVVILPAHTPLWVQDLFVGIGATSLIVNCTQVVRRSDGSRTNLLRILELPWVIGLGAFSYSLYLVHNPIQQAALRVLQSHVHSTEAILAIQLFIGVPMIVGIAYVFHLIFERRFMNTPPARKPAPLIQGALVRIGISKPT
jgi:peptidoglycan/LPS O-acetylase OafA/YrhL